MKLILQSKTHSSVNLSQTGFENKGNNRNLSPLTIDTDGGKQCEEESNKKDTRQHIHPIV